MSAYLDVAEADVMEDGWRLQTTVGIDLINQICSSRTVSHRTYSNLTFLTLDTPRHLPPCYSLFENGSENRNSEESPFHDVNMG